MGNRAVITTKENFKDNGVGIYLHWNGGRDSVEGFLAYCEIKEYREPNDSYGWSRLTQVIANFIGGTTSIGIDTVNNLDCDNLDNGVYIIDGWKIVGREYHKGPEQAEDPLREVLMMVDASQPEKEQVGEEEIDRYLKALNKEVRDHNTKVLNNALSGLFEKLG